MRLTWNEFLQRFRIGKIYYDASLEAVALVNSGIAKEGMSWLEKPKPLYLWGNAGSGKTFFQLALIRGLISGDIHKAKLLFVRSDDLDDELLRACENNGEHYVLEKYTEVPFLFIDDLGVERPTERVIKQYFKLIDRRLSNLMPTVFTSNFSIENITKHLGERIASRLEMCLEIKFPNKDLRKGL